MEFLFAFRLKCNQPTTYRWIGYSEQSRTGVQGHGIDELLLVQCNMAFRRDQPIEVDSN